MKSQRAGLLLAFFIGGLFVMSAGRSAQRSAAAADAMPAAKVGDEVIGEDELERTVRAPLARLERQRYELLSLRLEQLIDEKLLAQEAMRRGISTEALLQTAVHSKTSEVTDDDVASFIRENRQHVPAGDPGQLEQRVKEYLRSQRVNEQRSIFVRELRKQTAVTVFLPEPASARVSISANKGFALGPQHAEITIVEFTDFQCPFCKHAVQTVKRLMQEYPGKVRWVFRDFPVPGLHPAAPRVHEAARCAGEQDTFWEYHDLAFARSPEHSLEQLQQYAEELHLDKAAFSTCLLSGKYHAQVMNDIQEGTNLGISGTPTFLINGLVLVGAQPYAVFQKLVDRELTQGASASGEVSPED